MNIEPGKCYYRKMGPMTNVRKVLEISDGKVSYEILYGPSLNRKKTGQQRLRGFARWVHGLVAEGSDYRCLDGYLRQETFLVRNTKGEPILRCGAKRARFYLRKGYVGEVGPGELQFFNDVTEERLMQLHGGDLSEFLLEVKNDHCVCCGATMMLTRHHVVPTRLIKTIPQPWRSCLSNVVVLCMGCHCKYEQHLLEFGQPQVSEGGFGVAKAWRDHFFTVMKPCFLPKGWDIVNVKSPENIKN